MPFAIPSFSELRDLVVASFSGYFPGANTNRFGNQFKRLSIPTLVATDNHEHIRQVGESLFPDTAEGEDLDRHGAIWDVPRKGAVGATGSAALRVFGTAGATVPNNEPMTHLPSGLLFETRSTGLINASGFLDVDVAALSTGEDTNLQIGDNGELTFDATPVSLDDTASIVVDLETGLDDELDGPYRARILNRIGQPAAGGNRNDWSNFLLEAADYVASGYVYPNRNGLGTVDLVALKAGTGAGRILDAGERSAVFTAVDALRPVSAIHRVLETTTLAVDVEITVLPESDPSFTFDWDDSTPLVVLSWVAATRLLTFTTTRPVSMEAGDRLVIDNASADGAEIVIESLSGGSAVVLASAPTYTPIATDVVYSGGPVVQPGRQAVIDLFDSLGSANPDSTSYGPWEGNLRLSRLFEVIQTSLGILDSVIVDPVANVEADDPSFPLNDTVELLIPGKILVRKQ